MLDKSNYSQPTLEARFADTWQNLAIDRLGQIDAIYHPNVHFIDPSGEIYGREPLKDHLYALYANVISCRFELSPNCGHAPCWTQPWQMTLQHSKLAKAHPITVFGISQLQSQNGLITYHRDYFDLGAMLYEHLPVIGSATRWLKSRVAP